MVDPYLEVIKNFNRYKVKYVVIGVSGFNYFVKDAREMVVTYDYDIFIEQKFSNVKKSIKILKKLDFELFCDGKKLTDLSDIVKNKKTIFAKNYYGCIVELLLAVSGFSFEEIEKNVVVFTADRTKVKVCDRKKLLKMKEIAARPKDILFLKRFKR